MNKLIAKLITKVTNALHSVLSLFIAEKFLLEWKPIHLCWWFEKHNFQIPKYFIGTVMNSPSRSISSSPSSSASSSVSSSPSPSANTNLMVYHGSYTGNSSTKNVSGVGFKPDFVLIRRIGNTDLGTVHAYMASAAMPAGNAVALGGNGEAFVTGVITSLDSDGFTLPNNAATNFLNDTYYFVAVFDSGAKHFATGLYTGDATDGKAITGLAFQPDFVSIHSNNATKKAMTYSSTTSTNKGFMFSPDANQADTFASLDSGGFTVNNGSGAAQGNTVNVNAKSHMYWAFKSKVGYVAVVEYTGDGTNGRVINLGSIGFTPVFGLLKGDNAVKAILRFKQNTGDQSQEPDNSVTWSNTIEAFGSETMTVGDDTRANQNGVKYSVLLLANDFTIISNSPSISISNSPSSSPSSSVSSSPSSSISSSPSSSPSISVSSSPSSSVSPSSSISSSVSSSISSSPSSSISSSVSPSSSISSSVSSSISSSVSPSSSVSSSISSSPSRSISSSPSSSPSSSVSSSVSSSASSSISSSPSSSASSSASSSPSSSPSSSASSSASSSISSSISSSVSSSESSSISSSESSSISSSISSSPSSSESSSISSSTSSSVSSSPSPSTTTIVGARSRRLRLYKGYFGLAGRRRKR